MYTEDTWGIPHTYIEGEPFTMPWAISILQFAEPRPGWTNELPVDWDFHNPGPYTIRVELHDSVQIFENCYFEYDD